MHAQLLIVARLHSSPTQTATGRRLPLRTQVRQPLAKLGRVGACRRDAIGARPHERERLLTRGAVAHGELAAALDAAAPGVAAALASIVRQRSVGRALDGVAQRMLQEARAVEEHVDCLRFESRTVFAVVARSVLVLVDEGVLGADPKRRAREVRRVDGIRNQRLVQREFEAREAIAAELAKLDAAARILAGAAAAFVGIAGERFAETNRRVA